MAYFVKKEDMKIIFMIGVVLSGIVSDKTNNEPLVGVEVTIDGNSYYTDMEGRFEIPTESKSDTINLSYISYEDVTIVTPKLVY